MYLRTFRTGVTSCLFACALWAHGCGEGDAAVSDAASADAGPANDGAADAGPADDGAADAGPADDGAANDGGEGEAGAAHDSGAAGMEPAHLVFATSSVHTGALGGPAGADAICAERALAAGLAGEFVAWMSTANGDARARLEGLAGSFARTDGAALADDLEDLLDGELKAPIDHDEMGRPISGDAWTGSLSDGRLVAGPHCQGFTSGSVQHTGLCGSTQATDGRWSAAQEPTCDAPLRLYCFQL